MKKLILLSLVGIVGSYVAVKTDLCSYTGTFLARAEKKARSNVSNEFKLDHVRLEIGKLDNDISDMARPIAVHTAKIKKLRSDIDTAETTIKERKEKLLGYLKELETGQKLIKVGDDTKSAEWVARHLASDTKTVENLEKEVHLQKQELEARETTLKATQEQLAKVITKRDEYKIRVSQLEAKEAQVKLAKIGSDIKLDDGRTTKIESLLNEVEDEQDVLLAEIELLRNGTLTSSPLLNNRPSPGTDLQALRKRLEGKNNSEQTASK